MVGAMWKTLVLSLICGLSILLPLGSRAEAGPIGYSVRAHTGDVLYAIDLGSGNATIVGRLLFGDAEGLALVGGTLFAIGGAEESFWDVTLPPGVEIGGTGPRLGHDAGLAENASGLLYNLQADLNGTSHLYTIDPSTGAATFIGSSNTYADGLAIDSAGRAFAVDGVNTDALYSVDLTTGALTFVGSLGLGNTTFHAGLSFDEHDTLWMVSDISHTYTIDTASGYATQMARVTTNGYFINGFMGLAIDTGAGVETQLTSMPEPASFTLLGIGGALAWMKRRRSMRRNPS